MKKSNTSSPTPMQLDNGIKKACKWAERQEIKIKEIDRKSVVAQAIETHGEASWGTMFAVIRHERTNYKVLLKKCKKKFGEVPSSEAAKVFRRKIIRAVDSEIREALREAAQ